MDTTTLDKYTQELVDNSVMRGKFIAYREVMALLTAEADKQPTTSGQTLENLWTEIGNLLGVKQ